MSTTMNEMKQKIIELGIPIQEIIFTKPIDVQQNIYEYLMYVKNNDIERKAYGIAYSHLGTSFNILKSIGYIDWIKTNKNNK